MSEKQDKSLERIESEFDLFFQEIGFKRVSEDIGHSPSFKNADYVHKQDKIIVELKILDKEYFSEGGIIDSLRAQIIQPINIDDQGLGQYTLKLPKLNREGKYDEFEEPLRRVLKKANKQIRETKSFYKDGNNFCGFVMIAQVGLSSISPEVTGNLIRKLLFSEFKSIQGAIVCTPYVVTKNPITMKVNPECVSVTNESVEFLKRQCMKIADSWITFLENGGHK